MIFSIMLCRLTLALFALTWLQTVSSSSSTATPYDTAIDYSCSEQCQDAAAAVNCSSAAALISLSPDMTTAQIQSFLTLAALNATDSAGAAALVFAVFTAGTYTLTQSLILPPRIYALSEPQTFFIADVQTSLSANVVDDIVVDGFTLDANVQISAINSASGDGARLTVKNAAFIESRSAPIVLANIRSVTLNNNAFNNVTVAAIRLSDCADVVIANNTADNINGFVVSTQSSAIVAQNIVINNNALQQVVGTGIQLSGLVASLFITDNIMMMMSASPFAESIAIDLTIITSEILSESVISDNVLYSMTNGTYTSTAIVASGANQVYRHNTLFGWSQAFRLGCVSHSIFELNVINGTSTCLSALFVPLQTTADSYCCTPCTDVGSEFIGVNNVDGVDINGYPPIADCSAVWEYSSLCTTTTPTVNTSAVAAELFVSYIISVLLLLLALALVKRHHSRLRDAQAVATIPQGWPIQEMNKGSTVAMTELKRLKPAEEPNVAVSPTLQANSEVSRQRISAFRLESTSSANNDTVQRSSLSSASHRYEEAHLTPANHVEDREGDDAELKALVPADMDAVASSPGSVASEWSQRAKRMTSSRRLSSNRRHLAPINIAQITHSLNSSGAAPNSPLSPAYHQLNTPPISPILTSSQPPPLPSRISKIPPPLPMLPPRAKSAMPPPLPPRIVRAANWKMRYCTCINLPHLLIIASAAVLSALLLTIIVSIIFIPMLIASHDTVSTFYKTSKNSSSISTAACDGIILSSSASASLSSSSSPFLHTSVTHTSSSLPPPLPETVPEASYYILNWGCNISSAKFLTTITSDSFGIDYSGITFGSPNNYFYAIWNVSITANVSGTYLIGVNNDWGVRLKFNGVVYADTLSAYSYSQAPLGYSLAASVSLMAGQTYPITLEYCSQSCQNCNTLQLLYTPPFETTTAVMPVFSSTTSAVVQSLSYFMPINVDASISGTSSTSATTSSNNTIGPQIPGASGKAQTTCPSIPWTSVTGSCPSCQTSSWYTSGTYTFTPDEHCTTAWVQAWGGAGQDGRIDHQGGWCAQLGSAGWNKGGAGGYTSAVILLAANTAYSVVVGSGGNSYFSSGGGGYLSEWGCGIGTASGGGLSGLYADLQPIQPLLVAGGGGGGGSLSAGGSGGGLIGEDSSGLYYGTGGNSITNQSGYNTYYNQTHSYPSCVGANYGSFIYSGGGGGLFAGGHGATSACGSASTINTPLLSFWGAGGGSGYMCGQGNTQYGITLRGDDTTIPRQAPYYPGAGFPNQLLRYIGNDGAVKITCLSTRTNVSTTTVVPPTPEQIFGPMPDDSENTCPPYALLPASNSTCNAISEPTVSAQSITACPSSRTFYLSQLLGNDSNNGSSPSSAWASVAHVNNLIFSLFFIPGDTIAFCRGDVYMRQMILLESSFVNVNTTLYPFCSIRFTSYVCDEVVSDVFPLFTLSSILPQSPKVGWQPTQWTLLNGTSISALMYNFSLLDSLSPSSSYLPPHSTRQSGGGVENVWVNAFPYVTARHPNAVDLSVNDYNHRYGTSEYEWMHFDPNDLIISSSSCYTPPDTRISPGSWCNHIWHDLFAQNTTRMNLLLRNASFFDGAWLFADGAQGYTTVTMEFTAGGSYLNASMTYDCEAWYNMTIAPYFPSNITWGYPVFDAIPVPYQNNTQVSRAYVKGFTDSWVECDPDRVGVYVPRGVPSSVTNLPLTSSSSSLIEYAYNDAFILSNHYGFLDAPGEFWYNVSSDCLYLIPYSPQHARLLTTVYNTYDVSQVQETVHQGASASFHLASVEFANADVQTVFNGYDVRPYDTAAIIEIDSLEFAFGGVAAEIYANTLVFHHNIVRSMTQAVIMADAAAGIITNNVIVNNTWACMTVNALHVLVLNNSCAYVPQFAMINTNGAQLELVRGNSVVGAGCIGISMAGGNTNHLVNGQVQPTIAEFNWVESGSQLCAQWAVLNSNQGVMRYNEITNMNPGNWNFLHYAKFNNPASQSAGMTTIQNNQVVDNNILINSSGAGIFTYAQNGNGNGFTTVTNNLNINADYYSQTIDLLTLGNNQLISTANVLDQPGPYPYMYPAQVNVGAYYATSTVSAQSSVCNGLLDYVDVPNNMLSKYWNGQLGQVQSVDGDIPALQPSTLYTDVNAQPQTFVMQNLDLLQKYNAEVYNWIEGSNEQSQMTWGNANCTYYAEQQLQLKRAQNCQARINSERGIWEQIYLLYPGYHTLSGMCWPPTADRSSS